MENTTRQPTAPGTSQDVARASAAAVGRHVRGRLLGVIAVTSVALLTILSATFSSGGLLGGRALTVVTAMLVLGGAFVILRAAISHDECARRVDGLCRELESSNTRLKEFSFTDDVTGLYNRRFFAMRLEDEVSRYSRFNQPLSVVMHRHRRLQGGERRSGPHRRGRDAPHRRQYLADAVAQAST